jgi:DegV family protein with EDD domain
MHIKIITDSCCDLPLDYVERHADVLKVLGMPIQIEDKEIIDDLGKNYSHADFYEKLRKGILPTTSQINVHRFTEAFKEEVASGNSALYIGFSSALSGTFNSANIAKNIVLDENPGATIQVLDTRSASIGLGVMIMKAVDLARSGRSMDEIVDWVQREYLCTHHWFGVDDLFYLRKGGRINAASAAVGTVLNVKPTLVLSSDGYLKPYGNVRGRKKSINFLVSKLEEHYHPEKTDTVLVGHGNALDDALMIKENIELKFPSLEVIVSELSMTIASHVGPGMIAIAFVGKEREF